MIYNGVKMFNVTAFFNDPVEVNPYIMIAALNSALFVPFVLYYAMFPGEEIEDDVVDEVVESENAESEVNEEDQVVVTDTSETTQNSSNESETTTNSESTEE